MCSCTCCHCIRHRIIILGITWGQKKRCLFFTKYEYLSTVTVTGSITGWRFRIASFFFSKALWKKSLRIFWSTWAIQKKIGNQLGLLFTLYQYGVTCYANKRDRAFFGLPKTSYYIKQRCQFCKALLVHYIRRSQRFDSADNRKKLNITIRNILHLNKQFNSFKPAMNWSIWAGGRAASRCWCPDQLIIREKTSTPDFTELSLLIEQQRTILLKIKKELSEEHQIRNRRGDHSHH